MTEFSRTKKYQDLRERLQNDTGSEVLGGKELSEFSERLDQLDSNIYRAPIHTGESDHSANHARNIETEEIPTFHRSQAQKNQSALEEEIFGASEPASTPSFDNDYLDEYIREVKQYNIDQGNAETENTSVNILRQIERNQNHAQPVTRPYPRSGQSTQSSRVSIPFSTPSYQEQANTYATSGNDSLSNTQNLTKEDIMAEVQNMVNGSFQSVNTNRQNIENEKTKQFSSATSIPQNVNPSVNNSSPFEEEPVDFADTMGTDTFMRNFQRERLTNQQLLNETTKMRAQLDDYEDNLNEVTDKMRRTNQIMNIILIVLIIALLIILFIVVYFIILTRGA